MKGKGSNVMDHLFPLFFVKQSEDSSVLPINTSTHVSVEKSTCHTHFKYVWFNSIFVWPNLWICNSSGWDIRVPRKWWQVNLQMLLGKTSSFLSERSNVMLSLTNKWCFIRFNPSLKKFGNWNVTFLLTLHLVKALFHGTRLLILHKNI